MNNAEKNLDDSFRQISYISTGFYSIKGTQITSEMMNNARRKYAALFGDKLRTEELKEKKQNNQLNMEKSEENNVIEFEKEKNYVPTLKQEPMYPMKKAGFADALILTIIVLVYAAIIINLILKLK